MPPGGRPLGAKGSKQRRQWEREQALLAEQIRVEELDSDDSDGINSGFVQKRRYVSDPSRLTGIDLGEQARARRSYLPEESDEDSDSDDANDSATQIAMREKEERLVQSALARIRRAQEKGKKDVKLHEDEVKALERRRKRLQAEAAKKKSSGSSGSDKARKRSDRMVTVPIAGPEQPRRRSAKGDDGSPSARALPAIEGPGIRMEAADGSTSYAAIGSYPSSLVSRSSPSRPRSASSLQHNSRRTPPPQTQYQAYNPNRHASDGNRPTSSSSLRRPLPDEEGWEPVSRRSSISSNHPHSHDPFDYQTGSDTGRARRGVSGPAEVLYSNIPRRPPSTYALQARGAYNNAYGVSASDPTLGRRRVHESESEDEDTSSLSDSDDMGHGAPVGSPERERERRVTPPAPPPVTVSRKATGKKKGKK